MRVLIAVGVGTLASLVLVPSALACTCADVPSKEMLREADGAAVARLMAVRPVNGDLPPGAGPADFVYRTGLVVKGRKRLRRGRRLIVRSQQSSAACGLSGRVGRLSGLFLYRANGRWHSDSCSQTSAREMRRLKRRKARKSAAGGCR